MKIYISNKSSSKKQKEVILKNGMVFVHVTEDEAISLIASLSHQIEQKNPNSGRLESFDERGTYFSIGVDNFKKTKEQYEHDIQKKTSEEIYKEMYKFLDKKEKTYEI